MSAEKKKRSFTGLFWGRMAEVSALERFASLVFVAVAIASLSFCQLGFWPIGVIDGKPVYLMLILAPLAMGALMFGPITGALLGLYAGAVLYAHALFFPLDYYELYYMTPLNTFALFSVLGALMGVLFNAVMRRDCRGAARVGALFLVCTALSFAASALMMANTVVVYGGLEVLGTLREYLFNSPLGIAVQALVDAALMVVLCYAADAIVGKAVLRGSDRTLLSLFRNRMLLVSAIVFMLSSGVVFSQTTQQAQDEAEEDMLSEVQYLQNLLETVKGTDISYNALLDGYEVPLDGYAIITDENGVILASDDDEFYCVGESLVALLGYAEGESAGAPPRDLLNEIVEEGGATALEYKDRDGVLTMDFLFAAAGAFDGGYVVMLKTPTMVYASRFGTMVAITVLAILLIAAMAVVATLLLNRVVVRRIDETNGSLGKITDGDLSERVRINDTAEFTALSRGINTTVSALKDTIAEVEQKNAQDLATAKAIQESTLPREFPPFPDIDKFDVYASMKTAKEVGGDFYDFFLIEDGSEGASKIGFVMADVSGKGIPAALFMMTAKTQIRNYMESGLPVSEAIDAANHQLCIGNDAGMFVTAWVGVLDYETGLLTYVNAGHNPPLLFHAGAWGWMKDVSGMPMGLFDGIPYDAFTHQLDPGDMLYAYTDGVTEAMDADGNLFGEDRLERTLGEYAAFNPRSVGVGVRRAITEYTLDCEQSDDITMLVLKYGVPPEKRAVMVLPAVDTQLVHVYNFIHEELKRRNAPKWVRSPLDIAAEELFVNVCHYAYPDATPDNPGEVRIGFEYEASPPSLTVTISDDGIPYDPLAKPDAVTPDDIMDVPIGGLGILMAKKSVDEMTYERVDGSNVVTFVKKW